MGLSNKTQRFQVTLPATTVMMIDDLRQHGEFKSLSDFLNQAARFYAVRWKKANLKRQLKAGYKAQAQRDSASLSEWETASAELLWGNSEPNSNLQ